MNVLDTQNIGLQGNERFVTSYRKRILDRQQTLLFYTAMLCVFTNAVLQNVGQTFRMPNYDRPTLALGLVCVFFLMNNKEIVWKLSKKAYMNVFVFWALFCALAAYSSFVTKDIVPVYNPVTKNILFQCFVFEGLCIVVYAVATERTNDVLNFLLSYNGILVILTDLLMFGGIRYYSGVFETYLIGSKFDVTYLHMNFVALFFVKLKLTRKGKKEVQLPLPLLATVVTIIVLIGVRVDCNTGMSGALVFIMLVYACDRWPTIVAKRLASPKTFTVALFLSVMFAFYVQWILSIPAVVHLIVDTMHRSLTLTGRTDIYSTYASVMQDNWSWGFGYGNAYPISWKNFGYTDTQNALLEWILQIGVICTIAMVILFYVMILFYQQKASLTSAAPLLALLYVYIMLGTVEITLNNNFWLLMFVLFMLACDDQKVEEEVTIKLRYTPRQTLRRGRRLLN